jgi:hypothetical protein
MFIKCVKLVDILEGTNYKWLFKKVCNKRDNRANIIFFGAKNMEYLITLIVVLHNIM